MSKTNTEIRDEMINLRANPDMALRRLINTYERRKDNETTIVDASNAFVFLLECGVAEMSASMLHAESLHRAMYPKLANTQEEIYPHMKTADFAKRFALPAADTEFIALLSKGEIMSLAVYDEINNVRKIVIPKHTVITVGGTPFSIHYPIEIRVMENGGITCLWDIDGVDELKLLPTNVIEHDIYREATSQDEFLRLFFKADQFYVTQYFVEVMASTGTHARFNFLDDFWYCKVFNLSSNGNWEQIETTHSEQTYPEDKLTAVLKVVDNVLDVSIPTIYEDTPLLGKKLKVHVYTTKGKMYHNLADEPAQMYNVTFRDLTGSQGAVLDKFSAPLEVLTLFSVVSTDYADGGRGALTTEELKERVIHRTDSKQVPVTPPQLEVAMSDKGYTIVPVVDNLTDRVLVCYSDMPKPEKAMSKDAAGTMVATTMLQMDDIRNLDTVVSNTDSLTILPETLYRIDNDQISIVSDLERKRLDSLSVTEVMNEANAAQYLYTPYHYVLDTSHDTFSCKGYYLDAPKVNSRYFITNNTTVPEYFSSVGYELTKTDKGYRIKMVTQMSERLFKMNPNLLHTQLAFTPPGEITRAYANGLYIGVTAANQRVYQFDIETSYVIDRQDLMYLNNFRMSKDDVVSHGTELAQVFDMFLLCSDASIRRAPNFANSEIDVIVGSDFLPKDAVALSHESLTINFGTQLGELSTQSRTLNVGARYRTYATDVPWTYTEDKYEMDPDTGMEKIYFQDGKAVMNKLHSKGDIIYEDDGVTPSIRYHAGTTMKDEMGKPIPLGDGGLIRHCEMMFVDGKYRYATEPAIQQYRKQLAESIVRSIENDIKTGHAEMLGRTKLYLAPRRTMGKAMAISDSSIDSYIDLEQTIKVDYWLTQNNHDNLELRQAIVETTREIIVTELKSNTVTIDGMLEKLRNRIGSDIIGCRIYPLAGDLQMTTVTLRDKSVNLSTKKRLELQADGISVVREAIDVNFIRHQRVDS